MTAPAREMLIVISNNDARAIDSLERALLWEPDWDEGFQIAWKAIWALGRIGTNEALQVIVNAAEVGPEDVREQAATELRRRPAVPRADGSGLTDDQDAS